AYARVRGYRSQVAVPLLRHDEAIGTVSLTRAESGGFTDDEIALLQTFADQAVIAIENVRLFTELQASNRDLTDAHSTRTATSEVFRVISHSQADVQPVFAAILDCAVRLCEADAGAMLRVDNDQLVLIEIKPRTPEAWAILNEHYPRPVDVTSLTGRAVVEARIVHVPDTEDPTAPAHLAHLLRGIGYRSQLSVPILRKGLPIGVLTLTRRVPGPFSEPQVELVQTFAEQAVIAIENARLLGELQARTQDLTRSVGQLTALGEVGRAVSSTLDLETVLTTIVSRAVQLADVEAGAIYQHDESAEVFPLRAPQNLPAEFLEIARPLALPKGEGVTGRLAVAREPVQIPDITVPDAYHGRKRYVLLGMGHRALLAVPLISEDHIVGGLVV